jgi:hypothetical protein
LAVRLSNPGPASRLAIQPHSAALHAIEDNSERTATFTLRELRRTAKAILRKRFKGAYKGGYARKHSCWKVTRLKGRCKVSWVVGDLSYKGRMTLWVVSGDRVKYRYRIRQRNHYCIAVGGEKCSRIRRS